MLELAANSNRIPSMSNDMLDKVRLLERLASEIEQIDIDTLHVIHAGMYARTVFVSSGVMITGAQIKRATLLIFSGDVSVFTGVDEPLELNGYNVIPASANRKQAFVARTDMHLTMIFPSDAKTVEEAEKQFTDETEKLLSHRDDNFNHTLISGE